MKLNVVSSGRISSTLFSLFSMPALSTLSNFKIILKKCSQYINIYIKREEEEEEEEEERERERERGEIYNNIKFNNKISL